jgi:hypothetical protein
MIKEFKRNLYDAALTILPIVFIVQIITLIIPVDTGVLVSFLISSVLLIFGSALFTWGAELSMELIGNKIGKDLVRSKKVILILVVSFIIGTVVTVAEPDLLVLAEQLTSIPSWLLIIIISFGVGLCTALASARSLFGLDLNIILIISFIAIFILMLFVPNDFIPVAFDSGGVTTGTISIPFILTLGMGLVANRIDSKAKEESFGLVALASTGPIIMVLLLGLFMNYEGGMAFDNAIYTNFSFGNYITQLGICFKDVLMAITPILLVFLVYQLITKRTSNVELHKITLGTILTVLGLTVFLVASNVGFLNMGYYIGDFIGGTDYRYWLIPIIMILAFFISIAEPAVVILIDQVEEFTEGGISKGLLKISLALGVAIAAGLAMYRVFTGTSFMLYALIGYGIALILTFFIPKVFTAIAFDAGGATGGSLTTTFLLPIAIGACYVMGGNVYTDAFGLASMVSLVPIITVEITGLFYEFKTRMLSRMENLDDSIIDYEWEV